MRSVAGARRRSCVPFRNLGEAVRLRMFRGDLTAEQIAKIAEAIDAAARTIDNV